MTTILRPYRDGGWVTREGSRKKGARLTRRLASEMNDTEGLFITLTTDTGNGSACPDEIYQEHQRNKAVSRFLAQVSDRIGKSLKGKWLCKLEFTQAGYVHYHIVIKDITYIKHCVLAECWARGHVWVNKYTPCKASYLAKYVSKENDLPSWTLAKPVGYFKFVRASHGFWSDVDSRVKTESADPQVDRIDAFKPIGYAIEEENTRCTLECLSTGRRISVEDLSVGESLLILTRGLVEFSPYENGFRVDSDFDSTVSVLACAAAGRPQRAPLHLIKGLNRAWIMEYLCS